MALPPGWTERTDQCNRKYYTNTRDGTTTWEDPRRKRRRSEDAEPPRAAQGPRWECLGCRMTMPARRDSCPKCNLTRGEPPPKPAAASSCWDDWECDACGSSNSASAAECVACGGAPPEAAAAARSAAGDAACHVLHGPVPCFDELRGKAVLLPRGSVLSASAGLVCGFHGVRPDVALDKFGTPTICANFSAAAECPAGTKCSKFHVLPVQAPGVEIGATATRAGRGGARGDVVSRCHPPEGGSMWGANAMGRDGWHVGVDWGHEAEALPVADLIAMMPPSEVLIRRSGTVGDSLGIELDKGMVLTACARGSPAAVAGTGGFIGAKLERVNGVMMVGPADIPDALRRFPLVCSLRFCEVPAHQLLDVSRTASEDEVLKSFRRLAIIHHPDKNPDDRVGAERRMKRLVAAKEQMCRDVGRAPLRLE
eukprot:TRINITY_DN32780_c0_g1_i1.p1 TRINITY_DN32780_c0_g1~~TRINITY_DN32780_c0_g1_i1.p1  ORF type:complete len:452 (+),score=88.48 TRINITY_DN32780_c0_g1_i1:83-1357(+)